MKKDNLWKKKVDSPLKGDYIIMCKINKRKKDNYGTN